MASRPLRTLALALVAALGITLAWWMTGRLRASSRALSVHDRSASADSLLGAAPGDFGMRIPEEEGNQNPGEGTPSNPIRILAWNIAHGRGDVAQGLLANWHGGSGEDRILRLLRMAGFLRDADADLVVLNEVDFRSQWSQNLNQAEILARAAGYPYWVEQRNFDFQLPGARFAFGNAVLSRFPILNADWVRFPPHSHLEEVVLGAKAASLVRIETRSGVLGVVPIHMEFRPGHTRLAALPVLDSIRRVESMPLVLAGDFNAAPSGWPGASGGTVLDSLLSRGWMSPRASESPGPRELTFPTPRLQDARDWILFEAPWTALETRVLHAADNLSDHAPVLSLLAVDGQGSLQRDISSKGDWP